MTSLHPTTSGALTFDSHPYAIFDAAVRHAIIRDLDRLVDVLDEPITDVRRAALTEHIAYLLDQLQSHHRVQDEVIWPRVAIERGDLTDLADRARLSHTDLQQPSRDLRRAAQSWSSVRMLRPQVHQAASAVREAVGPVLDRDAADVPVACEVLSEQDWTEIGRRLAPPVMRFGGPRPSGPTTRARRLFWLLDDADAHLAGLVLARTPRAVLWVLRNGFSGGYNRAAYLMWVGGGTGPAV